jgi:hypothetical protein
LLGKLLQRLVLGRMTALRSHIDAEDILPPRPPTLRS